MDKKHIAINKRRNKIFRENQRKEMGPDTEENRRGKILRSGHADSAAH